MWLRLSVVFSLPTAVVVVLFLVVVDVCFAVAAAAI